MEIDYEINIGNFEVYNLVIYGKEFKMKILIYDGDYICMSKDIVLLFVNSLLLLLDGYI